MNSTIAVLERAKDRPARPARAARSGRLRSFKKLIEALAATTRRQVWVLRSEQDLADLIRAMAVAAPRVRAARLISYSRPAGIAAHVIESAFERALIGAQAMVEFDELKEILGTPHPEDYCIAAGWDEQNDTLALWRGDFSVLVVPMTAFPKRGGVSPDPRDLSIEDCGQTVRMGKYEVSVDAVLFERDEKYRRRAKKRMVREQQGFGPSIRRLRLMRGIKRTDFPGLGEKTIARIERGEVESPHRSTLKKIAKRLGVPVEQLSDY